VVNENANKNKIHIFKACLAMWLDMLLSKNCFALNFFFLFMDRFNVLMLENNNNKILF